jgi:hypothetical protein
MELAKKPCYPIDSRVYETGPGLTFRERLVIALASNGMFIEIISEVGQEPVVMNIDNAKRIIQQADTIIKGLQDEADCIERELKSSPLDANVKPANNDDDFDNWEVWGSNSGCTGIVLNHPEPGDESVCFRNRITGEFKYKLLGK